MTLGPLMVDVAGPVLTPADIERLQDPVVGGVILFARNFASRDQLRELVASIHAVRNPPLLVAADQEGGRVQRFRDGFFPLPPLRWIGHQYDMDPDAGRRLAFQAAWIMATDLRDVGVDFSFAPVVDLDHGISSVIGDRAFHHDAEAVAVLAGAYLQGLRRAGMIGVAKHFPGHGGVVADSHLELPEDHRARDGLYDDLLPFVRLVESGAVAGVMVAHVRYPAVDAAVASLSAPWMRGVLRDELGFRGAVFSDDLSMQALAGEGGLAGRALGALQAGADMVLVCNDPAGADQVRTALAGHADPAGQARLASLRPRLATVPADGVGGAEWGRITSAMAAALERPGLSLDG
jgi:beta-N-acetylhexosaminidase